MENRWRLIIIFIPMMKSVKILCCTISAAVIVSVFLTACDERGGKDLSGVIAPYFVEGTLSAVVAAYNIATDEFLADIDEKADALKKKIMENTDVPEFTGTAYYVSNNGDYSNDGTSPEKAWATLDNVNSAVLGIGDAVFFERGGLWRGQLKTKSGVTYSAYGKGDKPKLFGSSQAAVPALWSATAVENVYKYAVSLLFSNEPGNIILGLR